MILAKLPAAEPDGTSEGNGEDISDAITADTSHRSHPANPHGADPLGRSEAKHDDPRIEICHQLPQRLRLRFLPPISPENRIQIEAALEHHWPQLQYRDVNQGQGLVIRSPQEPLNPSGLIATIRSALAQPRIHRVAPPPSPWQRTKQSLRQGSIKLFLGLAVAGWVLPILPGTPFFLVAWWLGWRPPANAPQPDASAPNGTSNSSEQPLDHQQALDNDSGSHSDKEPAQSL